MADTSWLPPTTSGEVKLTSAFAAPISATEPVCTPEPGGQRIYGTQEPFDSSKPESDLLAFGFGYPASVNSGSMNHPAHPQYRAANRRSRDTVVKQLQAGASNDLCFGFTMTPNMEPRFQSLDTQTSDQLNNRLQNDPPVPDISQTHVGEGTDGDDLKRAVIDMPAGFAGAPNAVPACSDANFGVGNYKPVNCAPNSIAGTLFARLSVLAPRDEATVPLDQGVFGHYSFGGLANPGNPRDEWAEPGYVFNLEPGPNEIARLGAYVEIVGGVAPAKFVVSLVLTPDGKVRAITDNAPRRVYGTGASDLDADGQPLPGAATGYVYVEAIGIRAFGAAGAGGHPGLTKPFAQWGTNCSDNISADVSIETYAGTKSSMSSDPIKLTGCDALPFLPSVSVETTEKRPGVTTGATVDVNLGQTTSGPRTALLKDASVTLPAGLEIGAQVASGANGLPLCSATQFGKGQTTANTCPAGSDVGDVDITSPLLDKSFTGNVYLGAQGAVGELPNLYIEAALAGSSGDSAPRIKLVGEAKVDENGNLTTTFKDAPQLRFSKLRLTFPAGPNALFSTPRACGTTTGTSSFTSWASSTPVAVNSSLTIDQDCDGAAFAPSFSMVPANAAVGASSPTKITIERPDRSPWLKDVKVSLPAGFLADLKVASECSKADAAAAACPDSSRIATVTTTAGVGEQPLTLKGAMYLVERDEGAVAGAAIVVRAKIGELDLGNVVVPGRIELRPLDAGLVLTTTAPLRFRGLALNLRSIAVDLDRENFPLNPTACGPLRATADLVGDGGQTASPTSDVTYTGCGNLPFQPAFSAKLSGDTKPLGHPQVDVTMVPRAGDANLKSVKVALPAGVSTDINNIQVKCPTADFQAGNCSDATKVGTVKAKVSITDEEIAGAVHMVEVEGSRLPGLGLIFKGRYAVRLLSKVSVDGKTGRLTTEFASIPDLPLRRMELTVAGGAKSPIQLPRQACTADTSWDAVLSGQGGQSLTTKQVEKCATPAKPTTSLSWSRKSGLKFTLKAPAGKTLKSGKLTLPSGFKLTKKKSSQKKYVKVKLSGGKGKAKISKTSISVTGTGAGPTTVTITIKPKGYTLPKSYKGKLKKGKKIKLKSRTVTADGTVTASTLTVKTK